MLLCLGTCRNRIVLYPVFQTICSHADSMTNRASGSALIIEEDDALVADTVSLSHTKKHFSASQLALHF